MCFVFLSSCRWAMHSPSFSRCQHSREMVTHAQTYLRFQFWMQNWSIYKRSMDSRGNVSKAGVQEGTTIRHRYQYPTVIAVLVHREIISTLPRKTKQPNNLRLDKLHTYMNTLTGMSKNNFVASRKHMKKCQFWKMSSLKGKSKCQRDRYFTHRERCLLGVAQKGVRIIFFPCWNELQLPGIKHTKQYSHLHSPETSVVTVCNITQEIRERKHNERKRNNLLFFIFLFYVTGKIETLICLNLQHATEMWRI